MRLARYSGRFLPAARPRWLTSATSAPVPPPAPEGLAYQPFQVAGIRRMLAQRRLINADEMGLGKTIQAIGCLNTEPSIERVLVVCPKAMLHTWESELSKWLVRPLGVAIVRPGKEPLPQADVLLINYEQVSKHKPELIARGTFDALICDEAHYLKNPETQRTQALLGALLKPLSKCGPIDRPLETRHLWLLTGTPLLNHPIELWPLLRACDPDTTRMPKLTISFYSFRSRYCAPKETRYGWDYSGTSNIVELNQRLAESGAMMRRTKKEVLTQLPPKRRELLVLSDAAAVERELVALEAHAEEHTEANGATTLALPDSEYAEMVARLELGDRGRGGVPSPAESSARQADGAAEGERVAQGATRGGSSGGVLDRGAQGRPICASSRGGS